MAPREVSYPGDSPESPLLHLVAIPRFDIEDRPSLVGDFVFNFKLKLEPPLAAVPGVCLAVDAECRSAVIAARPR